MKQALVALGAALALMSGTAHAAITQAKTTAGIVRGEASGTITQFKGIPFAAPPTGELRWHAPQPPIPWTGVRRTTSFGAGCMQDPQLAGAMGMTVPLSEDCLFADVWTPAAAPDRALPVLVWIYGGGFNSGATSVPIYDGAQFARQGGIVMVSIAYRVGPFGFLATPELTGEGGGSSGEYGLLDLVAGLKWVRDNVAQFGGDPSKVTIMGHSAGSAAVAELVASPLAKGLFRAAIAQSGGNFGPASDEPGAGRTRTLKLAHEKEGQGVACDPGREVDRRGAQVARDETRRSPARRGRAAFRAACRRHRDSRRPGAPVGKRAGSRRCRCSSAPRPTRPPPSSGAGRSRPRTSRSRFAKAMAHPRRASSPLYPHGTDAEATRANKNLNSESGIVWNAQTFARLQRQYGNVPVYAYWFHNPTTANPEGSGHAARSRSRSPTRTCGPAARRGARRIAPCPGSCSRTG